MTPLETPKQRWGTCPKPYNLTGEISAASALNRLSSQDITNLQSFSKLMVTFSRQHDVQMHLILAGSATNLNTKNYHDLDLLVHVEPAEKRQAFATYAISALEANERLIVSTRGSLILLRQKTAGASIYFRYADQYFNQTGVPFDVTFSDSKDGTFEDIVAFHRTNNLAFCEIPT